MSEKQEQLGWVCHYSTKESFSLKHLVALNKIISRFNQSKEAEKEIFDFADKLSKKYLKTSEKIVKHFGGEQ